MRRPPRAALAVPAATALVLSLAACGGDEQDDAQAGAGLESITVSDDAGQAPEIGWDGRVVVDETATETVVEGDGPEVAADRAVMAQLVIGNGFTESVALSTWEDPPQQPQIFDPADQLPAGILAGFSGATVGSRTVTVAPPEGAFGEMGNPQLNIGNGDSVLFVMDVLGVVQPSVAEGEEQPPPGWPRIRTDDQGVVTGLNTGGAEEPSGELEVTTLSEGRGPRVQEGDFVAVTYLGQTADGDQPFDQNFTAGEPDPANPTAPPPEAGPTVFSLDGVVDGWKEALVGVPTRSRVMLEIPPELGYGEEGQPPDIQGGDTLYFVIDVLGTGRGNATDGPGGSNGEGDGGGGGESRN